ncbi:MAG: ATP-binding cassette domain-containing protein [Leptonema sp. (in: Bacteria)]|nr:ATP-binding cassette domain-containing protein [Leptonema sp. (in: bacteria)]
MSEKYLEFEEAKIGFDNLVLIDSLTFRLNQGDRLLLLGANGSGKSTLISILLGNKKLQSGKFTNSFEQIGYVPQQRSIEFQYPITVEYLLQLNFLNWSIRPSVRHSRKQEIDSALEKVEMFNRRNRLLSECSGGELQRAFLARSFLLRPDVLILDEPVSAVDQAGRIKILSMLKDYYQDYRPAIILTSHDTNIDWQNFFTYRAEIKDQRLEVEKVYD